MRMTAWATRVAVIAATLVMALALSGCAGAGDAGAPTAAGSTTAIADPTLTSASPTLDPESALRAAAAASCTRATKVGVVETRDDGTAIWVLVPDELAYRDYTAAYLEFPDTYELALETSFFAACSADVEFAMRSESGMTPARVTQGATANELIMSFPVDESLTWTVHYRVGEEGLITEAYYPGNAEIPSWTTRIRYGDITPDERRILLIAVDRFLAQ